MRNKLLAVAGIVIRVLYLVSSATDQNGAPLMPAALVLLSGTAELAFVVVATISLWRNARAVVVVLAVTEVLLLLFEALALGVAMPYGSVAVITRNAMRVANLISFIWVIVKLFRTPATRVRRGGG
jgi:hypothetical protein